MLQYKMYPAGELQLLLSQFLLIDFQVLWSRLVS